MHIAAISNLDPSTSRDKVRRSMECLLESRWDDDTWIIKSERPGISTSGRTLRWNARITDGLYLSDECFSELVCYLKYFIASLFLLRMNGRPFTAGSLVGLSAATSSFSRWWNANGRPKLSNLTGEDMQDYLSWHIASYDEDGRTHSGSKHVSRGKLERYIQFWRDQWAQKDVLNNLGFNTIQNDPLEGVSVLSYASRFVEEHYEYVEAFPDQFAVASLSVSWNFIRRLYPILSDIQPRLLRRRDKSNTPYLAPDEKQTLLEVQFGSHIELSNNSGNTAPSPDDGEDLYNGTTLFRRALIDFVCSCEIIILACTGIRISELCSIRTDNRSRIAGCVSRETSDDGLLELFYLHGYTFKSRRALSPATWTIGCRPIGSESSPPVLDTLLMLNSLLRPWREIGGIEELLPSFSNHIGLPRDKASVISPIADKKPIRHRNFLSRHLNAIQASVGLESPKEDIEFQISNYQPKRWRKTFAEFIFRSASKMIEPISTHFKHVSLAMTENMYLGSQTNIEKDLESTRQKLTELFVFEAMTGRRPSYGPFSKSLENDLKELSPEQREEESKVTIERIDIEGLKLHYGQHGKCAIQFNPSNALCYQSAGQDGWRRSFPNFSMRSPDLCLGCKNFVIDKDHIRFWSERLETNKRAYKDLSKAGDPSASLFKARYRQAEAILKVITQ